MTFYNTFNADDFLLVDSSIRSNRDIELASFRSKFNYTPTMSLSSLSYRPGLDNILNELFDFFYNDILISAANFKVIHNSSSIILKIKGYHAENTLSRIVSFWDYLFLLINEYLETDLLGSYQIRDKLILSEIIDFSIERDSHGSYKPLVKPKYPEKYKIKKRVAALKKLNKVFNLSKKNKNNTMYKAVTNKFVSTSNLDKLFSLYKNHAQTECKTVRNEIIHQRSLGFINSLAENAAGLPSNRLSIEINREGWSVLSDLVSDIDYNLDLIFEALQITYDILAKDEFPNSISMAGRVFKVKIIKCQDCNHKITIPLELYDAYNKDHIKCNKCFENEHLTSVETRIVNERQYFDSLVQFFDMNN